MWQKERADRDEHKRRADRVRELTSRGLFDWVVTDEEAKDAASSIVSVFQEGSLHELRQELGDDWPDLMETL